MYPRRGQVIKVNIWVKPFGCQGHWNVLRRHSTQCVLSQTHDFDLIIRKASHKPRQRDVLQNSWPSLLMAVQAWKGKSENCHHSERLRKCDDWMSHGILERGWGRKGHQGKPVKSKLSAGLSQWWCTRTELWRRPRCSREEGCWGGRDWAEGNRDRLYYLCDPSGHLQLIQDKKLISRKRKQGVWD